MSETPVWENTAPIYPCRRLTVVIRNEAPMLFCQDPPTHRTVQIELTEPQVFALRLRWIGHSAGTDYHESVSQCFFEPDTSSDD